MGEWRDIESAPDDGTRILVCGGRYVEVEIVKADGGFWRYYKLQHWGSSTPTRWMPIPPPPADT